MKKITEQLDKLVAFFFGEKGIIPIESNIQTISKDNKLYFDSIDDYILYLESKKDFTEDDSKKEIVINMRNITPPPDSRRVRDIKQKLSLIDSLSEDLQKAQWKEISECADKYSKLTQFEESNLSKRHENTQKAT